MPDYADYNYYRDIWRGALSEDAYAACAARASREIDVQTGGRARKAPESMRENLSMCACELADAIEAFSALLPGTSSLRNDGLAVTVNRGASEAKTRAEICRRWLQAPVNLMLRWI